ncbi:MAG TPA: sulfatase-like hydrolase/transferase, partial [Acidobacteriota bacterium]|nr:sulfatase-like hydrolase/transferase [Acidobacteriota bacterium]
PTLDRLAGDGVIFDSAYCQVPLTPPSHASILTGTYPATHGLRDFTVGQFRKGTITMAKILKGKGYQTAAFVSAFVLDRSWGLNDGFDLYYDHFDLKELEGTNPGNVQRRAEETIDAVLPWLEKAQSPFFLWVHLFDPHHNYDPPPPYSQLYSKNLYAGEVAYADSQLGRLLSSLETSSLYADSLIVALSDHGEALGDHGENEHGFFLYEPVIKIPFIIKLPRSYEVKDIRVATIAETVDVLPTVLQVLRVNLEPEWGVEGRGLLSTMLRKRTEDRFAYAETLYPLTTFGWSPLNVFRQGPYKYIHAPRPELYDLSKDPKELSNLYSKNQALANQLRTELMRVEQSFTPDSESSQNELDSETIERLNALGYVATASPLSTGDLGDLPDPKDKVEIFNKVLLGLQASEAGKLERSNSMFREVINESPELFIVHYSLGLNYLKIGDAQRALDALERAAELNTEFLSIEVNRARALSQLGRTDEAIEVLKGVTGRTSTHLGARRLLAQLYARSQRLSEAISIYRYILELRPEDQQAMKLLGATLVQNREYAQGLETLIAVLDLGVDDALVRNSMGIALENDGQMVQAIDSYRTALRFKQDYSQARLNLCFALLKAGKRDGAQQEFDRLCAESPRLCAQYRERFQLQLETLN